MDIKVENTKNRPDALKWSSWRSRVALVVVGLGVAALVGCWSAGVGKVPEEIRARKLVLETASGKPAAILEANESGSSLVLLDGAGRRRALLGVDRNGTGLALYNEDGKEGAFLAAAHDGSSLHLFDQNGSIRAILEHENFSGTRLELFDKAREGRALLGSVTIGAQEGRPEQVRSESSLVLFKADGSVLWEAP